MVEMFTDIDPDRVRANLEEVRAVAGPEVEILVAGKYVPVAEMGALAEAGVELIGENRLPDLEAKVERWGETFTWDFIGNLQSRKVRDVLPLVRLIHSVGSESVARKLAQYGDGDTEVLVQVNVAGEEGKGGIDPGELGAFIAELPVRVVGLSTMPPFAADPEESRPHFARLAELAAEHDLERLSMGTTQDWRVAVEEGATTVRLGSLLFR
jgi:PLP dependent protein